MKLKTIFVYALIALVIILIILVGYYQFVISFIDKPTDRGLFGDSFGALNAIFTGLAFVVIDPI